MLQSLFKNPESGVLDSSVLANFVGTGEPWSIKLLKLKKLDTIQYIDDYEIPHAALARQLGWKHSSIGFAGGLMCDTPGIPVVLEVGGDSLSSDFVRTDHEKMRAFELIEAMLAFSSVKLEWKRFS